MKEPLPHEFLRASPKPAASKGESGVSEDGVAPKVLSSPAGQLTSDKDIPETHTASEETSVLALVPSNTERRSKERTSMRRTVKWLTLGLGIKRWAVLSLLGLMLAAVGAALATAYIAVEWSVVIIEWVNARTQQLINTEFLGLGLLAMGFLLVAIGLRGTLKAVERAYASAGQTNSDFLETALRRRKLNQGERIVAIGGGTGLSTMLRGLKEYSSNITAVVTMADDGGSSGMLREHGILPPGDLRNCIAALAEAEPQMTELFQHRFAGLGPLKGHSVGNLIVAAMCEIKGDYVSAVRETSKVLAIRGSVLPSTLDDIRLGARLKDGTEILGQVNVNKARDIHEAFLIPAEPRALPDVVKAIEEAELIIIGPGSLFTSIIPNLLVPEIAEAIKRAKVPSIYVCNVMTQPHETANYKASDHVAAIIRHIGRGIITHALINNGRVKEEVLDKYRRVGAEYVTPDEAAIEMLGVRPIKSNFIDDNNLVRHNPQKLATTIFRVLAKM